MFNQKYKLILFAVIFSIVLPVSIFGAPRLGAAPAQCFVTGATAGTRDPVACPDDGNFSPDKCYTASVSPSQGLGNWREAECDSITVGRQNRDGDTGVEADCMAGADADNCGITRYLVLMINVLSVLAGIVITGSIAYGGIQYSMAGDDPQKVSEAKNRIRNAIIALLFFIFGYGLLDFLVPGGLFR